MSATMQIDQAGLPAGAPGFGRTDGLDTGALVTLTSTGGGTTHKFRLLWVPPADATATASLAPTGATTYTFQPDVSVYGSYRIELIVDEGLPTEMRQILTFVIRTPNRSLIIPAANEVADPRATILSAGPATIGASEQNEAFGPFTAGSSWGWWRALAEVIEALDVGAGGGPPTGPAGGDLAATYPNPTVDGLQTRPVAPTAPTTGQVLGWDGAAWSPQPGPSATISTPGAWTVPAIVSIGDVLRASGADTGVSADAVNAASGLGVVGVVVAKPTATTATVVYAGETGPIFGGLTPGNTLWLDVGGGIVNAPPGAAGNVRKRIGVAKNATTLVVSLGDDVIV